MELSIPPHIAALFHAWTAWCFIGFALGCFLVLLGNYHDKKDRDFTEMFFKALTLSPLGILNILGITVILGAIGVTCIKKKLSKQ